MAYRTVQSRGYCSRTGYARVDRILRLLCTLGNAALQERLDAWKMARENITYQDQCKSLTLVRQDDPDGIGALNVSVARGALQRVGPDTTVGADARIDNVSIDENTAIPPKAVIENEQDVWTCGIGVEDEPPGPAPVRRPA